MKKHTEKVHYTPNPISEIERLPVVYSPKYAVRFFGMQKLHPFDAAKGSHIIKLLKDENFICDGKFYSPDEITKEELLKVHTTEYLRSLKSSINAAKISEIPLLIFVPNRLVQRGYLRPMRFQTAGSILAGKLAIETGWSINLGGGFHHCCSKKGESKISSVMIVDLDAHQGNGHERDFLNDDNVFIFDMYNAAIYPKDHPAKLAIKCAVELKPRTEDNTYMRKLKRCLQQSMADFHADLIVYNAGTDILQGDPLGLLSITPQGVIERDEFVFSTCRQQKIPIVMLLSGGYLRSSAKVIANSIMNLKDKGLLSL